MDEKKNKNNLEVTETAEEKVEKAGEQTEQEENFFKKTWNRVRKLFKRTRKSASITFPPRNPAAYPKRTSKLLWSLKRKNA